MKQFKSEMPNNQQRRDFLQQSLSAAGLAVTSPFLAPLSRAFAQINNTNFQSRTPGRLKNLVMVHIPGGWDVTLLTDPKTHSDHQTSNTDLFIEYRPDQILRRKGGLRLGPAGASLVEFAADIVVANGVYMRRDSGHQALTEYLKRGHSSVTGDLIAEFSANAQSIGPLGVLKAGSLALGDRSVTTTEPEQLLKEDSSLYSDLTIHGLKTPFSHLGQATLEYVQLQSIRKVLRTKFVDHLTAASPLDQSLQFQLIATALSHGYSYGAVIDLANGEQNRLDTHSQHVGRHLRNLTQLTQDLSNLFATFKSIEMQNEAGGTAESVFDHTLFVITSEMSRTPYMNGGGGKDHNIYTNSVIFAGGGIRGNRTLGGSHVLKNADPDTGRALHIGLPFDFAAGQTTRLRTPTAGMIFPENIAATVLSLMGAPESVLATELEGYRPLPI